MMQQILDGSSWEAPDGMKVEEAKANSLKFPSQCSRRNEYNAGAVLHFLDGRQLRRFKVTRKLRGVATSPTEKQRS